MGEAGKLHTCTNQPKPYIWHALMDDDGVYTPQGAEAISMRISCSAFNQLSEQEIAGEDGWLWGNAKE